MSLSEDDAGSPGLRFACGLETGTGGAKISGLSAPASTVENATNSLLSWRLVRGDERLKIFRCITALTEQLAEIALVLPDPQKALFCEVLVYLTRPRAMRLPTGTFYAMFVFNRSHRFCATVAVRSTGHPRAGQEVATLVFSNLKAAEPPGENPDPAAEVYPETPLAFDLEEAYARPVSGVPDAPNHCYQLSPGAWWHFPSGQIYCWHADESLLPLLPPGSRARHLGWLLARIANHPNGCEDCAGSVHADPVNALWDSREIAGVCPCVAPCAWMKLARRDVPVEGDGSLAALLFRHRIDSIYLMGSLRAPRITDDLSEVVRGRYQHTNVPLNPRGWHLTAYTARASRVFACACPAVSRIASVC
ncbi:tegument protein UL16 [Saimiriine alphaherpesvirus 1]|uniref:Tegument protein UL16 n=1 Tax=Saimiriine herpesvirus 1 (strain MV-5-4-PSL) TaxID=10353 RepID=E2IUF5_SHV1|nr:tegument protein UL16 [Saimiriine alphaherpesvirus 1]ADO13813.1 tegument protein UL16 [Saimiriine alphaherpesvirus 1]